MKKLFSILRNKTLALTIIACFATFNIANAMESKLSETEIAINKDFEDTLRKEWIEIMCSKKEMVEAAEVYSDYLTKK